MALNVQDADVTEPQPKRNWWYRLQRSCDKSMGLRTFMRFVPILAVLVSTTALYFGIRNYLVLEGSRATAILRQLAPVLRQAHADIQASLAGIERRLNITRPGNSTGPGSP